MFQDYYSKRFALKDFSSIDKREFEVEWMDQFTTMTFPVDGDAIHDALFPTEFQMAAEAVVTDMMGKL